LEEAISVISGPSSGSGGVKQKKYDPMTRQIKARNMELEEEIHGKLRVQSIYSGQKFDTSSKGFLASKGTTKQAGTLS
jgi:hypothetical protein